MIGAPNYDVPQAELENILREHLSPAKGLRHAYFEIVWHICIC